LRFRIGHRTLQALQPGHLALRDITGEMIPGVDIDPPRVEGLGEIDIGA
jgi:hypothetical protein